MVPCLVVLAGPLEGRRFELTKEPITFGRQASNRIAIREISVSRRHAELSCRDGEFLLRDLGSSHGTLVNSQAIEQRVLKHGDLITLGASLFVFLLQENTEELHPLRFSGGTLNEASTAILRPESTLLNHPQKVLAALPEDARLPRALHALLAISRAVCGLRTVEDLSREFLKHLFEAVPAEHGALLLLDRGGELAAVATRCAVPNEPPQIHQPLVDRVFEEGTGILSQEDAPAEGEFAPRSLLYTPITLDGRPLGLLHLETTNAEEPFDPHHLELVAAAAEIAALALDNARRIEWLERERSRLTESQPNHELVGESPAMQRIYRLIGRIAPTDSTVLLSAESGCGKELVAHALHSNSPRAGEPFVAVNCATLSETLLESELFGHEKGAFTGSVARQLGKFELADGGTLFLDEIGEIPVQLQAKLLRALQERKIERLGGRGPIPINVRVVAATNRDLPAEMKNGRFREDLYYRLNVFHLKLPALRRRREDIPLLTTHFLHLHCQRLKRPLMALSPAAREAMLRYAWPGNVRELSNAIERAVVLAEDDLVRPEDLPEALFESPPPAEASPLRYHEALNAHKRRVVLDSIQATGGNITRAAERLDLSPNYLHRLISHLGLRAELGSK